MTFLNAALESAVYDGDVFLINSLAPKGPEEDESYTF